MSRFTRSVLLLCLGLLIPQLAAAENAVCQFDESVAYAPRTSCSFPACPEGANCPGPEMTLDRVASSVEMTEPLVIWAATCPAKEIAGGCWQATYELALRLRATGATEQIGVKLTSDASGEPVTKPYYVKAERISDTRVQARLNVIYYVAPGQSLSLRVDALCAKGKSGRELCVTPPNARALLKTANQARR